MGFYSTPFICLIAKVKSRSDFVQYATNTL